MLQDSATVEANFQRFIERIIRSETVFYLSNDEGVANSISNEDQKIVILLFWCDRGYASRAKGIFEDEFIETEMTLFDFLYRWLPGMSGDGVLAGPNWDGNLIGKEVDPYDLRIEIEESMPPERLKQYEERFRELTNNT